MRHEEPRASGDAGSESDESEGEAASAAFPRLALELHHDDGSRRRWRLFYEAAEAQCVEYDHGAADVGEIVAQPPAVRVGTDALGMSRPRAPRRRRDPPSEYPRRGVAATRPRDINLAVTCPLNIQAAPRGGAATRPRNIHVVAAAPPPSGYPRRGRGAAALGISTSRPAAAPRPAPTTARRRRPQLAALFEHAGKAGEVSVTPTAAALECSCKETADGDDLATDLSIAASDFETYVLPDGANDDTTVVFQARPGKALAKFCDAAGASEVRFFFSGAGKPVSLQARAPVGCDCKVLCGNQPLGRDMFRDTPAPRCAQRIHLEGTMQFGYRTGQVVVSSTFVQPARAAAPEAAEDPSQAFGRPAATHKKRKHPGEVPPRTLSPDEPRR